MPATPHSRPDEAAEPSGVVLSDPLSEQSSDDTDTGWGELPSSDGPNDDERFRRERPPHHGD